MRRWWDALRRSDPHIQLLVAVLAPPLVLAVLGALALFVHAGVRLAGGG